MENGFKLKKPWLIAVWPGMGNVAITAGYYMMSRLDMHLLTELPSSDLFDVDHVEIKGGLIRPGRMPRNLLFVCNNAHEERDIVVFVGEAQPPLGRYAFCQKLMDFSQKLGVERVFTFAAMATQMHPEHDARVFGAAIDTASLDELRGLDVEILEEGRISGLNGVLLGVAAERNIPGCSLLGEIPHIFSQVPSPKASLAVLKVFSGMANIEIDLSQLQIQANVMEQQLGSLLSQVEQKLTEEPESFEPEEEALGTLADEKEDALSPADRERIETLFEAASQDRARAYELKEELDRLEVFTEYEDRFLDLFKKPDDS